MCCHIFDGLKSILKCEMNICPAILVRNVTAISDFCFPDVNEGSQNFDPSDAAPCHSDCWGTGGMQEGNKETELSQYSGGT